jgi:hypothetical protein
MPPKSTIRKKVEGERKFVSLHYTVNEVGGEIVILSVKRSARRRGHEDV